MTRVDFKSRLYEICCLERPGWLLDSGLSKGIYHDRSPLMIIVLAGGKMRFRQTFPASNSGVTLNCLNDDSKTEAHYEITTEWAEVYVSYVSVPFFSTPYTEKGGEIVNIEVEVLGDLKCLPFYSVAYDADLFFQDWDSQEAEYAVVDSACAKILIPAKDKDTLKALHQATGLKSLVDYYDGIFEYFNYLAGLSFNPVALTDKNIPNRFFMKADKSGRGAAYYGHAWTAQSSDSVANFWLNIKGSNWGSIHEIGHGYEGMFANYSTVYLREVWNNVLAAHYQKKVLGEDYYKVGWLYASGEERLYGLLREHFDSGTVGGDLSAILFFLLLIFDRTGEQGIIEFYRRYRRLSNGAGFKPENYLAMDLLSAVAIDVANVNVSEFMSFAKVSLTPRQMIENAYSNAIPFYPVYRLVQQNHLKPVQAQLGLRSPLDLVSCKQLSVTGLTADMSFVFEPDVYNELNGKSFLLSDGRGAARVVKIENATIFVEKLPLGLYVVELPSAEEGEYQPVSCYVAVTQAGGVFNCVYRKSYASGLADQTIFLGGLAGIFCKIGINVSTGCLLMDVVYSRPHVYFKEAVYARVIVKDEQGDVVFSREMQGQYTELFSAEVPIAMGYVIELFHKESSRMSVSNSSASAVIENIENNTLKITNQGLLNISYGTDAGENLRLEIDKNTAIFARLPHLALHDGHPIKQDFRRAINTFAEPIKSQLFERYRTLEFHPAPVNQTISGTRFTWRLEGLGGHSVADMEMNTWAGNIRLVMHAVRPHAYFSSVYISIMLKSPEGEIIHFHELRGDVPAEALDVELPFVPGTKLTVMHREPVRTRIVNNHNQEATSTAQVQHVHVSRPDVLSLSSYWPAMADES